VHADARPHGVAHTFTDLAIAATMDVVGCVVILAVHRAGFDGVAWMVFAGYVIAARTCRSLLVGDPECGRGLTVLLAVVVGSLLLWAIESVSGSSGGAATAVLGVLALTAAIASWHRPYHMTAHPVGSSEARP